MSFRVKIRKMLGFEKRDRKKYFQACRALQRVLISDEFYHSIMEYGYYVDDIRIQGFYNCDLTRLEVYNRIMSGSDMYEPKRDAELDIKVRAYYSKKKVVGWTKPSTMWTNINVRYLRRWSVSYIAGHILHEALHNMGFTHAKKWHLMRKHSVPYAVGNIVRDLIKRP